MINFLRKKGGILGALGLTDWFSSLGRDRKRKVRYAFSLKVTKDLSFPYKAGDLEKGKITTLYTKRTFLGTLAQTLLLEGDYKGAEWLYLEAIKMEGTPYEEHLILNDLLLLYQKLKDFKKMEEISKRDVELFSEYKEELFNRYKNTQPQVNSFSVYIYMLERKGKKEEALKVLDYALSEGLYVPFANDIRKRLMVK